MSAAGVRGDIEKEGTKCGDKEVTLEYSSKKCPDVCSHSGERAHARHGSRRDPRCCGLGEVQWVWLVEFVAGTDRSWYWKEDRVDAECWHIHLWTVHGKTQMGNQEREMNSCWVDWKQGEMQTEKRTLKLLMKQLPSIALGSLLGYP